MFVIFIFFAEIFHLLVVILVPNILDINYQVSRQLFCRVMSFSYCGWDCIKFFPSAISAARLRVSVSWSRIVFVLNHRVSRAGLVIGFRLAKSWPRLISDALSGSFEALWCPI